MFRRIRQLRNVSLHAVDGDIGHVEECYFDDQEWKIRYLVVNTGSWLLGKEVLISPHAVKDIDLEEKKISLDLTIEKIKNSPDIDTDRPISRRKQQEYHTYYGFPVYPAGMIVPVIPRDQYSQQDEEMDIHLRSSHEVCGYRIAATDGAVGHVEDFIFDDQDWTIRYIVVDTRNILPGKKVVLSPVWIQDVKWSESKVVVNSEKRIIRNAPEFDPAKPLTREYEEKLFDYYDAVKYWLEEENNSSG